MTERLDLPDGQHCMLRSAKTVPERLRRPVKQAVFEIGRNPSALAVVVDGNVDVKAATETMSPEIIASYDRLNDLAAVALIESWSFPQPITVDGLQDLPGDAYDAIQAAVAPLTLELMPSYGVDGAPDPKAGISA